MSSNIDQWLNGLGLSKYSGLFADNDIDWEILPDLEERDLEKLGLSLGRRKKLLKAIAALAEDAGTVGHAAEPAAASPLAHAEAERRQLTVMFCDLVGSTELSARLDPEDMREVMRRYQDVVAGLVTRFEGHVAKFLGDGVLAFFGWPRAYEDQAERAVRSGLAAVEAVANLKTADGQALEARVGIATGQVVIGDIVGKAATEAAAVAGETPNLAARLQGVAAPGQVVIGDTTRLLIGEALDLEDIGTHQLRGFAEPVAAWRVIGESTARSRFQAAHPGTLSRLVGREPELALLRRAWKQSQADIGQVVLISGEPGIGKSRLVNALGTELKAEGCNRISLGCSPYHTNSALYPVIVHFERVLRWQREDGAEVKLAKLEEALQDFNLPLDEVIPLFASLMSLPLPEGRYPPLNLAPQQQKQRTLDAIVAWLLEEAERRPVLQVWEDLHWADPTTLELMTLEIEQAPTAPILNVLTFRPEFVPPWPQRSHMTPLTLNRLERPEVEALIGHHAGGKALPEEVVEYILGKTDGVPLYVEELTKAILEADFLRERNGSYELAGQLSEVTIPATLQDSLMARLDRLPNIREVAQLGAVLGREFLYEMVQAIASIDESTLQNGLDQLVAGELLYQRGRPPRAKYIFKHVLVQDAAYQSLLKRTRQYYHGQVAELLESRFPEIVQSQPELVAHHYTEAGQAEQAADYWQKAGRRAMQGSANVEAEGHLRKGLAVIESMPQAPERQRREIALQNTLGVCLMPTRGFGNAEVAEAFSRAAVISEDLGDSRGLFVALRGQGQYQMISGDLGTAREQAARILTLADELDEPGIRIEAHHLGWSALTFTGDFAAARRHAETGIALYERERDHRLTYVYSGHDPGVCCRSFGSLAQWQLGYPDQALAACRDGEALARELAHPFSVTIAYWATGMLHLLRRETAATRETGEAMIIHCKEKGFPPFIPMGRIYRGGALAEAGEFEEGIAEVRQGIAGVRAIGTEYTVPLFFAWLGEVCAKGGLIEEGLEAIEAGLALSEKEGDRFSLPEFYRVKGELLLARAAANEAEACFQQAIGIAGAQGGKSLELRAATSLARLMGETKRRAEACDLLAPIYGWFTEGFDTPDLTDAKALLGELA